MFMKIDDIILIIIVSNRVVPNTKSPFLTFYSLFLILFFPMLNAVDTSYLFYSYLFHVYKSCACYILKLSICDIKLSISSICDLLSLHDSTLVHSTSFIFCYSLFPNSLLSYVTLISTFITP